MATIKRKTKYKSKSRSRSVNKKFSKQRKIVRRTQKGGGGVKIKKPFKKKNKTGKITISEPTDLRHNGYANAGKKSSSFMPTTQITEKSFPTTKITPNTLGQKLRVDLLNIIKPRTLGEGAQIIHLTPRQITMALNTSMQGRRVQGTGQTYVIKAQAPAPPITSSQLKATEGTAFDESSA
jgi:hypothetical protein